MITCSQRKAVRSKSHKQLEGGNLDSKKDDKSDNMHESGDQDSAVGSTDNLSSKNEADSKTGDGSDKTEAIPKPAHSTTTELTDERPVSIALTSSGKPSKTFITDLKTFDPSMVRKKNSVKYFVV